MPNSGGDVFVHAKCDAQGLLFDLTQKFLAALPNDSVKDFEDVYGFTHRKNRDLSGFVDGIMNPKTPESRQKIAVEAKTGGSYVLTQKWIHDFNEIANTPVDTLEAWVGRTLKDDVELEDKPDTAHLARLRGGKNVAHKDSPFKIVRQSLPFGTKREGAGLFFIAYAASPDNFNFMLDNMTGAGKDGNFNDFIMKMSRNVKGNYWYFPGMEELQNL